MRETLAKLTALGTLILVSLIAVLFAWHQQSRMQQLQNEIDPLSWSVLYPLHVAALMRGAEHGAEAPEDKLAANPFRQRAWAGNAFALEYNASRAHYYAQIDQRNSRRTLARNQPAGCIHCHAAEAPLLVRAFGWDALNAMSFNEIRDQVHHGSACTDCHAADTMALQISRPALRNALAQQGIDVDAASRHDMRSYVCAQCHVEYYFREGTQELIFPWAQGMTIEAISNYYDAIDFSDWQHAETGVGLIKIQHPNFELHTQGVHAANNTSCADCHMPVIQDGGMHVTEHWIRSPLLQLEAACMSCHDGSSERLAERSLRLQSNTLGLLALTESALTALMDAIQLAQKRAYTGAPLEAALLAHRQAQLRWDFIDADASKGFHASAEAIRMLIDAIAIAREAAEQLHQALGEHSTQ
ncbi:MAG: ammonia-forming cytochrome c nitrite reductase subunit c552 [Nitrosomonas halophila]